MLNVLKQLTRRRALPIAAAATKRPLIPRFQSKPLVPVAGIKLSQARFYTVEPSAEHPEYADLLRHPSYVHLFENYPNATKFLRPGDEVPFMRRLAQLELSEEVQDNTLLAAGTDLARAIIEDTSEGQKMDEEELWEAEEELIGVCVRGLVEGVFRPGEVPEGDGGWPADAADL